MSANTASARPHIYEFDLLRTLTALTVVGVHVLAFTAWVYPNGDGTYAHYAVLDAIHWTRNVFLFITAFVLTYVYYGRPFSVRRFWLKRGLGVVLPYCVWSIAYTWVNNPALHQPQTFVQQAVFDIVTGNASYQLYYIMLTLQLYLVLPLFLWLLTRVERHPLFVLTTSLLVELGFSFVSYQYLQQGPFAATDIGQWLNTFQNRFLLSYQFYILLGGLGALYMARSREFLLKHGKAVVVSLILGLVMALETYAFEVVYYNASMDLASFVIQPAVTVYSLTVILFLAWVSAVWVSRAGRNGLPPRYRFWHLLSDASFGIYLVQAFVLDVAILQILPQMPGVLPPGLRVFLTWLIGAGVSALISIVLLQIPLLSRLVGRPAQWRTLAPFAALQRWADGRSPHEQMQVER